MVWLPGVCCSSSVTALLSFFFFGVYDLFFLKLGSKGFQLCNWLVGVRLSNAQLNNKIRAPLVVELVILSVVRVSENWG